MSNKKTPQSTITKSRIASSKWLQLLCAILTLALDVVVLLVLFVNTTEIKYIVCPILLLVLDLVFIVKVLLSNYRFMYAIGGVLIHVACIILACGGAVLASGALGDRVVFETIALIALPAVHLLQCIAALCNAWQAIRRGKPIRRIVALVTSAILVVGIGLYVNFLHINGFFGQGAERTERTVVYMLDDSGSYYIAVDVLDGKGNTVTIPAEFNGLPVKGVDCALFGHDEISYMVFAGSSELEFLNTDSLAHVNESLSLEVDKTNVDEFRGEFYALARENPEMLYVANHIKPIGLKEGDVYVIPRYDRDALALANGQILPTWFGSADEVLNIREDVRYAAYDCIRYSDVTDEAQLYWCYVNQQAQIFRWLKDSEGIDLSGAAIRESTEAYVTFDTVYAIRFGRGNDTLHTLDASYTGFNADGAYVDYKLTTADRAAEVIARIPTRNGFTLTWLAGPDGHSLTPTDMQAELAGLPRGEFLNVYPEWKLNMPTIDSLKADGVSEGHSAVYGDDVTLAAQATPPHESISLKYEWILNDVLGQEKNYIINNLHPQDATTYTLRVTAYADTTSLTATVEQTIDVGFEKRELQFDWNLPESLVYEAGNKPLSVEALDSINGDEINARLSQDSVRDAGEYTITVELYGDTADKYRIAESDASRTVVVTPYPLSVNWDDERSFVYDGTEQHPGASVHALGRDDVPLSFNGGQKNAGTGYRVTVTANNPNYTLTDNETTFEIKQRPITSIEWTFQDSFEYNAFQKVRPVNGFEGCIPGDRDMLISSVIYSGHQVNVGENYTATVSLPADSNYYFTEECNIQSTFAITPRKLTVKMNNPRTEYSGEVYTNFGYTLDGLPESDREEEIFTIVDYIGDAVTAVNARDEAYTFSATVEQTGAKAENYTLEILEGTLTITKKDLYVKIDAKSKTYDGYTFPEYEHSFTATGLVPADQDDIDSILSLTYKGAALEQKNAGSWTINAEATPVNSEKYENYEIHITKGTLTIHKAPATVTAIVLDNGKIYDGLPYTGFDFDVSGLVGGDQKDALGTPTYSGAATNNPNANADGHTLKVRLPSNDVTNNYDFTYEDDNAVILKKFATVTALGGTKVYDGYAGWNGFTFEVDGVIDADRENKIGFPHYDGDATKDKNVGVHELTVSLSTLEKTGNYDIEYVPATLVVTPRTVTVTLETRDKTYDAKPASAAANNFWYSVTGLAATDNKNVLGTPTYGGDAFDAVNAGTYDLTLTLSGNDNYIIETIRPATLTIRKREVTVSVSVPKRTYNGSTGGDFSYTVSGLQGSDTKTILGDPIYTGDAMEKKDVGFHTLYLDFASNELENYTVKIRNGHAATGTLQITKAKLVVTIDPIEKEYDGTPLTGFTYTVSGLVDGETEDQLGEPSWTIYDQNSRPISQAINAGGYSLEIEFDEAMHPNYSISGSRASCTITKRAATVTAVATDRDCNGTAGGQFDFTIEGLAEGDEKKDFTATFGGSAKTAKDPGTYTLTVKILASDKSRNYDFTYVNDDFVIREVETEPETEPEPEPEPEPEIGVDDIVTPPETQE